MDTAMGELAGRPAMGVAAARRALLARQGLQPSVRLHHRFPSDGPLGCCVWGCRTRVAASLAHG